MFQKSQENQFKEMILKNTAGRGREKGLQYSLLRVRNFEGGRRQCIRLLPALPKRQRP